MISGFIISDTADPEFNIISTNLPASSPVMMDTFVLTTATVIGFGPKVAWGIFGPTWEPRCSVAPENIAAHVPTGCTNYNNPAHSHFEIVVSYCVKSGLADCNKNIW